FARNSLPDGGALRLIRATVPYIKRLLNTVGPRKRSAAGQAVPNSVPVVVPDGGALRLIRATVPYIKRLLNTVGPRKRSAAGQAVPDPVPVVMPDGG
ncbi:hypothetical protein CF042_34450, partial [Klebsiella pneumoniae]|uniref:hypothetical protein n=1 Tax=Klebsiella pneumoniae TaxID=573 RepID=UPI001C7E9509